mmetsp:Transcript_21875/g.62738  ORF Transcript_21875/g.62738 Transcript_21875/m.62738 type:complete len:531 (-) Transcript_21875:89-1681(-)
MLSLRRSAAAAAASAAAARLISVSPSFRSSSASTADAASARCLQEKHDPTRSLPRQYLRDADLSNYDATTYQRNDVIYDYTSGRPILNDIDMFKKKYEVLSWRHVDNSDDGMEGERVEITWADNVVTTYPTTWLNEQSRLYASGDGRPSTPDTPVEPTSKDDVQRIPWSNLTEKDVRASDSEMTISFEELIFGGVAGDTSRWTHKPDDATTNEGMDRAIEILYKYGLLLVTDTPVHDGGTGVAALAAAISGGDIKTSKNVSLLARYRENVQTHENEEAPVTILPDGTDGPLRTLYGNVWSTHSTAMAEGASQADSAYSSEGLPLHNDMCYFRNPPGLQIFCMAQPAVEGGESIFADGLAIAKKLRSQCPDAFDMLCRTTRRYRSIDTETGWHLEGRGPVISAVDHGHGLPPGLRWGAITQVRHNDLDMLPDLPPLASNGSGAPMDEAEADKWYSDLQSAHREWDTLLASDEFRLVMQLVPGDTVVVANQRCFHGRQRFRLDGNTARIVMGCYVSQEDVDSRFRRAGYRLP